MPEAVFCNESWTKRMAKKQADRDRLRNGERIGELFAALVISLIGSYFISLQVDKTGFFTPSFGTLDAVLFYGTMFFGIVPALGRALFGRRNAIRPVDFVGSVLFIVSASWFLTHWAFDFSHFADGLPQSLRFIISWVTDGLAQALLAIALALTVLVAIWTALQYYIVRQELKARKAKAA